jgi:hypothetical protein
MFETFSHYLSYGATDQQTVRELAGSYDGLVVPGTVAAFQRQGTGGFVLALSATQAATRYVIDPRFPLFQQPLFQPKKSHRALAELLGVPELVSITHPSPDDFTAERIEIIANRWVRFNTEYMGASSAKFEKYARRLQEPVEPAGAQPPSHILAPYTIVTGLGSPWWEVSTSLFSATCQQPTGSIPCIRVVAATEAKVLSDLLGAVHDERLVVWVSDLEELETSPDILAEYATAIGHATARGQALFALYGGFFSVLLSSVGLKGSSHGIGYGEYRSWRELPQSGPPPARYYLPRVHRYIPQDLAYQLWLEDRSLAQCHCAECQGEPPIALEYHSLMKHSVLCRAQEIRRWVGQSTSAMVEGLSNEYGSFLEAADRARLPGFLRRSAERYSDHLPRWIDALRRSLPP